MSKNTDQAVRVACRLTDHRGTSRTSRALDLHHKPCDKGLSYARYYVVTRCDKCGAEVGRNKIDISAEPWMHKYKIRSDGSLVSKLDLPKLAEAHGNYSPY